jgi:hypothetical protein
MVVYFAKLDNNALLVDEMSLTLLNLCCYILRLYYIDWSKSNLGVKRRFNEAVFEIETDLGGFNWIFRVVVVSEQHDGL